MAWIHEVPELMTGAVRLREDAEEEVPILLGQKVAKQGGLPLDAGQQARPQRLVVGERAARRGGSGPAPRIMSPPVRDLDAIEAVDGPSEGSVDYSDPLPRPTHVAPERWRAEPIRTHP